MKNWKPAVAAGLVAAVGVTAAVTARGGDDQYEAALEHFSTTEYDSPGQVLDQWSMRSHDVGDGSVGPLYEYLRDTSLTPEVAQLVFSSLDAAVGDERINSSPDSSENAALTVARVYRALHQREDIDDLRSTLREPEAGDAAVSLAHALGLWSEGPLRSYDGPRFPDVAPTTSTFLSPGFGHVGPIPSVADTSIAPATSLAVATDESLVEFTRGVSYHASQLVRGGAVYLAEESRTDATALAAQLQEYWARVAGVLSRESDLTDVHRGKRLAVWLGAMDPITRDAERAPVSEQGTADTPTPAMFPRAIRGGTDELEKALTEAEPISEDEAREQVQRAGTFLLVSMIEAAGTWEDRPEDLEIPRWDAVTELEPSEWAQLVDTWQTGVPVDLDLSGPEKIEAAFDDRRP